MPDMEGARFVVSENGDILSPKYAPEIIAPAARPSGIPAALAIPINATPMVPAVDQELPVAREIKAEIIQAVNKNSEGVIIFNPQ